DFFAGGGSGGGIVDFFGAAGASSCALGRIISEVGTAFIAFEGGSPEAIWSVRTCSSMSQPSSVSVSRLSIEFLSSWSIDLGSDGLTGGGGNGGTVFGFGSGGGRDDLAGTRAM